MMMKNILLTIGIFIALSGSALAVESQFEDLKADLNSQIPTADLSQCQNLLVPLYDIETLEFFEFLDENFKNKSANNSLTNLAIARYSEYKRELGDIFAKFNPQASNFQGSTQQNIEYQTYLKCIEITDAYTSFAKEHMLQHIKNNTYQKRSSMMLEKYQSIGDRLREMNMSLAKTNAFFQTFKNKLPGFLQQCIVQ